MNIATKYNSGDIVYAVHPCRTVCGGEGGRQACADDIYIISPHRTGNITVLCSRDHTAEIWYELSGGIIRPEKDLFESFEDAAGYAAGLYGKTHGKNDRTAKHGEILKETVMGRIKHELELILTSAQMESLEEEFIRATQGLVFSEA